MGEQQQPPPVDPKKDPNLIPVYDKFGRQFFITKEVWRTDVLPGLIQSNWANSDQLYQIIISALRDGFRADIVKAAEHLYEIDPGRLRATTVWGIVLMGEGLLDKAEALFNEYMTQHGEDSTILTNLAKVFAARSDAAKVEEILWHSLELDPNQDNGMAWYYALHRERGGDDAGIQAWRRIAALPRSWRAQLWLAREALAAHRSDEALSMYRQCLSRVADPVPLDLLKQMSGDLGNAGLLRELLQLCEPRFDAAAHGLEVGNNLLKANLELGQVDTAGQILNQLYALKRMDWQKHLGFWDTEIAKKRLASSALDSKAPLNIVLATIEGPVWLKPSSKAAKLFPTKAPDAPCICFLGSSAEQTDDSKTVHRQLADARGRMSRALPLFLAEQAFFKTDASVKTLIPWISDGGGFVLSGVAWADEMAAEYARRGQTLSGYIVTTHLLCRTEVWVLELRVVRTSDGTGVGTLSTPISHVSPEDTLPRFSQQLIDLLIERAKLRPVKLSDLYQAPAGKDLGNYLLRLEQLLAVRCGGLEGAHPDFLSGEREIILGNIDLVLTNPQNVAARLVLAETLRGMKRIRPNIVMEFRDKIEMLDKERSFREAAHYGVIKQILDEAFENDK